MIRIGKELNGGRYVMMYNGAHEILALDPDRLRGGLYLWVFDKKYKTEDLDEHSRLRIIGVDLV